MAKGTSTKNPALEQYWGQNERAHNQPLSALLKSFITDRNVASIFPSSTFVQRKICQQIDFASVQTLFEFGAGDGAITAPLLSSLRHDGRLVAFETNAELAGILSRRFLDDRLKVVHAPAESAEVIRKRSGLTVDLIVSGIPLTYLSDQQSTEFIESSRRLLGENGTLILYQAYFPPFYSTGYLRAKLRRSFSRIVSHKVLLNVPPLEVLVCSNPP